MSDNAPAVMLSTFASPLRRLILRGGGGLPPAWGPLVAADGSECCVWSGDIDRAFNLSGCVLNPPSGWSLPLNDASPWLERLAKIATWMLHPRHRYLCAIVDVSKEFFTLTRVRFTNHERGLGMGDWTWSLGNGKTENSPIDLPTLPAYLANHPPAVALLLALYDAPEIRARVEAL